MVWGGKWKDKRSLKEMHSFEFFLNYWNIFKFVFYDFRLDNKSDVTQGTEKLLITCDCDLVTLMSVIKGKIEITTNNFYFYDLSQIKEDGDRHDFKVRILI